MRRTDRYIFDKEGQVVGFNPSYVRRVRREMRLSQIEPQPTASDETELEMIVRLSREQLDAAARSLRRGYKRPADWSFRERV